MKIYYGGATEINLCHSRYAIACNAIHWGLAERLVRGNKSRGTFGEEQKEEESRTCSACLLPPLSAAHLPLTVLLILNQSLHIHEAEIEM